MCQYDRIVVLVHDPALRREPLRDLVRVVGGGNPGTDVEELPDAGVPGKIGDGPGQERAVGTDREDYVGVRLNGLLAEFSVHLEVVLTAEPVVIDPSDMRHVVVELRHADPPLRTSGDARTEVA